MKKFLLKLLLFAILVGLVDFAAGGLYTLYDRIQGGEIGKTHKVMTQIEPDMLILGSSRASHHYNSGILEDSLGLSVYNAGFEGQGTLMAYGLLQGVLSRHTPKIILFEITPLFDLYQHPQSRSLGNLAPYVGYYPLDSLFYDVDPTDRFKLISNSYRYNSKLLRILPNLFSNREDMQKGFNPMDGVMKFQHKDKDNLMKGDDSGEDKAVKRDACHEIDLIKAEYIQRLIDRIKEEGITLVFAISPCLQPYEEEYYGREIEIARSNGIPVLNHYNDSTIVSHPEYFSDSVHLNYRGADAYTCQIVSELDSILTRSNQNGVSPN